MGNGQALEIEDVISRIKQKFPQDKYAQATVVKNMINLFKQNYGDQVQVVSTEWRDYQVVLTMFNSSYNIYIFWELIKLGNIVASGLEKYDARNESSIFKRGCLLFSSHPNINNPIFPLIKGNK